MLRGVAKQGKRFHFLGLNAVDTPGRARAFVRKYGWTWPSIQDPRRVLARRFGASYQPAFIVIDARGHYVAGFQSAGTDARWDGLVARLR